MVSVGQTLNQLPNPISNSQEQTNQPKPTQTVPVHLLYPSNTSPMASAHSSPYTQPPQGGTQPYALPPPQQGQEVQPAGQYPQYSYDIQLRYPQDPHRPYPPPQAQGLQLPPLTAMDMQGGYGQQEMTADTTGQVAPPGVKPRVTATLWEDEGTLCFQVDVKGTCVARREDNHMINGTKLLNVAGMTRGRRDGILKSEKQKHVVKIGPMHLKGVWIPFERALEFANKEKITELLYPLFVHNIGALLYHPVNRGFPTTAQIPRSQEQQPQTQPQAQPGNFKAAGSNGEQLPPLYS